MVYMGIFCIYIGDRRVSNFVDSKGDFDTDRAVIHEVSLSRF